MNVEVIRGWEMARDLLQEEWEELYRQADTRSPFTSFQWFDTWFQVFGDPETMRIAVVRNGNRVRAILPGRMEKRRYGGLPLTCFVFPADAQTPRSGVVCLPGDVDAARAAIMAAMTLDEPADLAILPDIEMHSVNWQVLSGGLPRPVPFASSTGIRVRFFPWRTGGRPTCAAARSVFASRFGKVSSAARAGGRSRARSLWSGKISTKVWTGCGCWTSGPGREKMAAGCSGPGIGGAFTTS